jgi:hypothetical protein
MANAEQDLCHLSGLGAISSSVGGRFLASLSLGLEVISRSGEVNLRVPPLIREYDPGGRVTRERTVDYAKWSFEELKALATQLNVTNANNKTRRELLDIFLIRK